ncbi:MAG: hypothetical protein CM1200mP41_30860 [Gammaproteobacteria bacterium]|nr:MAG: hypothetical protein CM1200mP41_30860 [Gammaproteobacteria bacterium]
MLAKVTDETIQIYGGMGLMEALPLERSGATLGSKESTTERAKFSDILSHANCCGRTVHDGLTC